MTLLLHAFFLAVHATAAVLSGGLVLASTEWWGALSWFMLLAINGRAVISELHDLVECLAARRQASRSTWALRFAIDSEPPAVRPLIRQLIREHLARRGEAHLGKGLN